MQLKFGGSGENLSNEGQQRLRDLGEAVAFIATVMPEYDKPTDQVVRSYDHSNTVEFNAVLAAQRYAAVTPEIEVKEVEPVSESTEPQSDIIAHVFGLIDKEEKKNQYGQN